MTNLFTAFAFSVAYMIDQFFGQFFSYFMGFCGEDNL